MEQRRFKRIRVNLKAEHISVNVRHAAYVENLSEEGLFIQTVPGEGLAHFTSGKKVELEVQLLSDKTIRLNCEVRWVYENPPDGSSCCVGMKIIDPPLVYMEFIKTLK